MPWIPCKAGFAPHLVAVLTINDQTIDDRRHDRLWQSGLRRRMTNRISPVDTPNDLPWHGLVALFLGGVILAWHFGGGIPYLSPDTVNDEKFIQSCCSFSGMGTSVDGVVMGANWWHFKTLWAVLGLSDTALHLLLHGSFALAVVLLVLVGARMRNQWVGYVAVAVLVLLLWSSWDFRMDMNYNHRGFPFLGTLILLLALMAVESGRVRYLVMASFVAAITANIHLQASLLFFSVGGVGLLMEGRRLRSVVAGFGTFGATAFATSPTAWIGNVQRFLDGGGGEGAATSLRFEALLTPHYMALGMAIVAMALLSWVHRKDVFRRRWPLLLLALLVPKFAAFGGAVALGVTGASDKYLIDVEPAVGLALGLAVATLFHALGPWIRKLGEPPARVERMASALGPYLMAVALVLMPASKGAGRGLDGFPMLQTDDMVRLRQLLMNEHGWNHAKIAQSMKGPANLEIIDFLSVRYPREWETPAPHDRQVVTVIKVDDAAMPDPVPPGWSVVRQDGDRALWASFTRSWLDWGHFRVCTGPWEGAIDGLKCVDSGLGSRPWETPEEAVVPVGFPIPDQGMDLRLRIEFAVDFPADGGAQWIFMPSIPDRCSGRIVAVAGGDSKVLHGGKKARLKGRGVGTLVLEWHVGGEGCEGWAYRAFVPYFAEGDARSVGVVEAVVEARWPGGPGGRF